MTSEFGVWLRQTRKALGMTQVELGKRSGWSKSYISNVENNGIHTTTGGRVQPSVQFVDSVACALDADDSQARRLAGYAPRAESSTVSAQTNSGMDTSQDDSVVSALSYIVNGEEPATRADIARLEHLILALYYKRAA